jgi:hypothetical protein
VFDGGRFRDEHVDDSDNDSEDGNEDFESLIEEKEWYSKQEDNRFEGGVRYAHQYNDNRWDETQSQAYKSIVAHSTQQMHKMDFHMPPVTATTLQAYSPDRNIYKNSSTNIGNGIAGSSLDRDKENYNLYRNTVPSTERGLHKK